MKMTREDLANKLVADIVECMDHRALYRYAYEQMLAYYGGVTKEELIEEAQEFYDDDDVEILD